MLTISQIQNAVKSIAPQYPIDKVELFGSYAEGNAKENSDVDVFIQFKQRPVTLLDLCGFQEELSEQIGVDVDIVKLPMSQSAKSDLKITKVVPLYESSI